MIGIIDYGAGNLFSLKCSLEYLGLESVIVSEAKAMDKCDRLILPGVGAFGDAVKKLRETSLDETILKETQRGKPLLGICLGMQMLFCKSYEYGEHDGLSLICGEVRPLAPDAKGLKIPHMGWNSLHIEKQDGIFRYSEEGDYVYFVHSYHAKNCEPFVTAVTEYGGCVTAAVGRDNVFGTQFHPEKSGEAGLKMLKAFSEVK
ncbi:MAG: imidazole glycerol phosphate synthase subunit HisH [Eubacteriales bacterium]